MFPAVLAHIRHSTRSNVENRPRSENSEIFLQGMREIATCTALFLSVNLVRDPTVIRSAEDTQRICEVRHCGSRIFRNTWDEVGFIPTTR